MKYQTENRATLFVENPPDDWEDCEQCGGAHPAGYTGDCRNDAMRWPFNEPEEEDA